MQCRKRSICSRQLRCARSSGALSHPRSNRLRVANRRDAAMNRSGSIYVIAGTVPDDDRGGDRSHLRWAPSPGGYLERTWNCWSRLRRRCRPCSPSRIGDRRRSSTTCSPKCTTSSVAPRQCPRLSCIFEMPYRCAEISRERRTNNVLRNLRSHTPTPKRHSVSSMIAHEPPPSASDRRRDPRRLLVEIDQQLVEHFLIGTNPSLWRGSRLAMQDWDLCLLYLLAQQNDSRFAFCIVVLPLARLMGWDAGGEMVVTSVLSARSSVHLLASVRRDKGPSAWPRCCRWSRKSSSSSADPTTRPGCTGFSLVLLLLLS